MKGDLLSGERRKIMKTSKNISKHIVPIMTGIVGVVLGYAIVSDMGTLIEGEVVDMKYRAAHTERNVDVKPMRISENDVTTPSYSNYDKYTPESWSIGVSGIETNGKPRSQWWDVGSCLYSKLTIGNRVRRDSITSVVRVL
jgi:xanthosine utilization system XapX-like protein